MVVITSELTSDNEATEGIINMFEITYKRYNPEKFTTSNIQLNHYETKILLGLIK